MMTEGSRDGRNSRVVLVTSEARQVLKALDV